MPNRTLSTKKLLASAVLSCASVLLSSYLLHHGVLQPSVRVAVALMPVPFFVAFVFAELHWIRESDEFHRGVILESLAIAFPSAIVLAVLIEALQKAGFVPGLSIGDVWPVMALTWIPALWIANRRFR